MECHIDNIDALYQLMMLSQEDNEYYQLAYHTQIDWVEMIETLDITAMSQIP